MQLNFTETENQYLSPQIRCLTKNLTEMLFKNQAVAASAIPWASPVPMFGDIGNAKIATLAINPSDLEFTDTSGDELDHSDRRFPTLRSLQLKDWSQADEKHIEEILIYCENYFYNNPYKRWFNELEYLTSGANASYYTGSIRLCHLDLVPFATKVKWSNVSLETRKTLLTDSRFALDGLLLSSQIEVLVLNGQMVVENFCLQRGLSLKRERQVTWDLQRKRIKDVPGYSYEGKLTVNDQDHRKREILVLGYNHNIQSSFGVSKTTKNAIRDWITKKLEIR